MNSLALTHNSQFPAPDRTSSFDLAAAQNLVVQEYPAAPKMLVNPMPADRRSRLEARQRALEHWLAPAKQSEHQAMAKAVASCLGSFLANSSGEQAILAKYVHVMADLPAWAVIEACQKIENAEVEGVSMDFRPSAPRVKDTARSLLAPWLEELFHIKAVLTAPVLEPEDAEMRKRLGKLFSQFASDFRTGKFQGA